MKAIEFEGQTTMLTPPKDWDNDGEHKCGNLPILSTTIDGLPFLFSLWKPSADELKQLAAGGYVRLQIVSDSHPPVALSVLDHSAVEELP
jgi:hypothetical protein